MPSLHSPFPSLQLDASSRSLLQSLPPENPKPKPQEWVQTPEAYPLLLYPNGTSPHCPGASGGCSHSLFQGTSPRLFAHLLPTHHVLIPAFLIPFISFAHSQPRFFFFTSCPNTLIYPTHHRGLFLANFFCWVPWQPIKPQDQHPTPLFHLPTTCSHC